jgi:hypothetical protein
LALESRWNPLSLQTRLQQDPVTIRNLCVSSDRAPRRRCENPPFLFGAVVT